MAAPTDSIEISAMTDGVAAQLTDAVPARRGAGNVWLSLTYIKNLVLSGLTLAWGSITGTPTTLAGYGITDAASDSELAAHEADTTSVHGIANTANLYAAGGTDVAVADGGTGASTAAAARPNLGAAPASATYIVQTADSELSAEQALGALATGYLKNTTTTGVLSVQATPIPAADGGALAQGRVKSATTYLSLPGCVPSGVGTVTISLDTVRYTPIKVDTTITLDRLICEITTASGTGGSTCRLGIYNADNDFQPTTLVLDGGTVASDSTGVKSITISQVLTPGLYLLAINSSHNGVAVRAVRAGLPGAGLIDTLGTSPMVTSLRVAQAYAAFPGTGTAWTTATGTTTSYEALLYVRIQTP